MKDIEIDTGPGFRRERFIRSYVEREMMRLSPHLGGEFVAQQTGRIEADARLAWDRLLAERQERLEAERFYRQVAHDDLRKLKKRLGPRRRMTVTIPERMAERLKHVPAGLRSATVTRLLARGYLWETAYGVDDDE